MLVSMGEQEGVVEQEERQMIHGILEMTDKSVREIMVPRVDVIGIGGDHRVDDLIRLILATGHSRIPVFEETIDNIVGVVYAKDLLRHNVRSDSKTPLRSLARAAYFTPETKRVGELLHDMQDRKVHIAIVVDEYGGTAGIITIEDLIEEIVGPIRDEYDVAEQEDMQFLSDTEVLMNARVSIDDVKEMLRIELDDVEADSIGGLVYERLGEIPKAGATIMLGHARLTVESIRRQSIQTIRITSPVPFLRDRNGRREEADAGSADDSEDAH
jgi:CBS domain containing-hemolysin-like protein